MINKYFEKLIISEPFKKIHLGKRKFFSYNVYSEENLTFWYDFAFRYGKRYYIVIFEHPRLKYIDTNEEKARFIIENKYPNKHSTIENFFNDAKPIYKFLGKNKKRKRIIAYYLNSKDILNDSSEKDRRKLLSEETKKLNFEGDTVITPFVKKAFKTIYVCVPLEIHNDDEAALLFDFLCEWIAETHKPFKHSNPQGIIEKWFGNYTYSKNNYASEFSKK